MIKDFVTIDFETATPKRYSICQVGVVTVKNNIIVDEFTSLIYPPGGYIHPKFTEIHGITNDNVKYAFNFSEVLTNDLLKRISNQQIVAHNISFDRDVLQKQLNIGILQKKQLKVSILIGIGNVHLNYLGN